MQPQGWTRQATKEGSMTGTIVCGVTVSDEGRAAAQLAGALSGRLQLRLVLAHVVDVPVAAGESLTARQGISGAERALAELVEDIGGDAEARVVVGPRAERLAQVAAEEGADLIVLGSRKGGLLGGRLRCRLAQELEAATPAPVLIAPPQTRRRAERRLALPEVSATR
jgi:nucleotide-binding universal stress UspA family protein